MAVDIPLAQFQWQDERISSVTPDCILRIIPEPGYERGRKARLIGNLWSGLQERPPPGLMLMDPDVVADPDDIAAMHAAACLDPTSVHTAAVKLWPASTGLRDWIWSHRGGTVGFPVATQDEDTPIAYWTTCLVYLPARLLDAAAAVIDQWQWLELDVKLPELGLQLGIPNRLVPAARPKHLHY